MNAKMDAVNSDAESDAIDSIRSCKYNCVCSRATSSVTFEKTFSMRMVITDITSMDLSL